MSSHKKVSLKKNTKICKNYIKIYILTKSDFDK